MDTVTAFFLGATSLALMVGAGSVIYTLPKVRPFWRPAYYMAMALIGCMMATFGLAIVQEMGIKVPRSLIVGMLEASLFLTALETILVPYFHRLEQKKDAPDVPSDS